MKVKITKTIDAGDIPSESRRMLDSAKNKLLYGLPNVMSEVVRFSLSNDGQEFFHTIELIKTLVEELATLSEQLVEVQNTIQGYKDFLEKVAEEQESEHAVKQRSDVENRNQQKMQENEKLREEIESYVSDRQAELEASIQQGQCDEEPRNEEAEYEKHLAQIPDEGEVEDEEG
jgi:hypothetical protein|tara:strand:+ start:732 stop:1253 length:522 start_codon:yes stop_codon:yes gene_type:complete